MPNEKFDQPALKVDPDGVLDMSPGIDSSSAATFPAALADRYEVLSLIGSGGMASVFTAKHKLTGRVDAVKVLHKQDPRNLSRFTHEAKIVSKLADPNIVSIYDFGIAEDAAFLVMEYVPGESLAELLSRQGVLDKETFTSIFDQIASGLEHAHRNGVVHRDLKPSNILITKQNGGYVAKIADFGIAKLTQQEPAVGLTHTGETVGTPLYMSPEQSMGQQAKASSDLYSLGCIMYESLTLVPPIAGENLLEVAHRRLNETPKTLADHGVEVSPEIELLVQRCLEKDPGKRFQSAAEIRDVLRGGKLPPSATKQQSDSEQVKRFRIGTAVFTVILLGYVCWLVPMFEKNNNAMRKVSQDNIFPIADRSQTPVVKGMEKVNFRPDIERGVAGRIDKSMPFYDANSGLTGLAYSTLQSNPRVIDGITGWKAWYQNIFNKLTYGVHVPKGVRSKINVTVSKGQKVVATIEWEDPTKDPLSEVFTQNLLSQIMKLNGNSILRFPENVDSVHFDVYCQGSEDSLRLSGAGHPVTSSKAK